MHIHTHTHKDTHTYWHSCIQQALDTLPSLSLPLPLSPSLSLSYSLSLYLSLSHTHTRTLPCKHICLPWPDRSTCLLLKFTTLLSLQLCSGQADLLFCFLIIFSQWTQICKDLINPLLLLFILRHCY